MGMQSNPDREKKPEEQPKPPAPAEKKDQPTEPEQKEGDA